jgi:uridine kinase
MTTKTFDFDFAMRFVAELGNLPQVIAISGPTCSGKTTFATRLTEDFHNAGVSVTNVPLDCYFRDCDDPDFPRSKQGLLFDLPSAYWSGEFADAVTSLVIGHPVYLPQYDLARNKRLLTPGEKIFSAHAIIAEGLFAGQFLDRKSFRVFKVFMDTPVEVCLQRRVERDVRIYGVSVRQATEYFRLKVMPYWAQCVLNQKSNADLIVKERR